MGPLLMDPSRRRRVPLRCEMRMRSALIGGKAGGVILFLWLGAASGMRSAKLYADKMQGYYR